MFFEEFGKVYLNDLDRQSLETFLLHDQKEVEQQFTDLAKIVSERISLDERRKRWTYQPTLFNKLLLRVGQLKPKRFLEKEVSNFYEEVKTLKSDDPVYTSLRDIIELYASLLGSVHSVEVKKYVSHMRDDYESFTKRLVNILFSEKSNDFGPWMVGAVIARVFHGS